MAYDTIRRSPVSKTQLRLGSRSRNGGWECNQHSDKCLVSSSLYLSSSTLCQPTTCGNLFARVDQTGWSHSSPWLDGGDLLLKPSANFRLTRARNGSPLLLT